MEETYIIPTFSKKDIPKNVLYFLTEINKRLKEKNFNKEKENNCVIVTLTKTIKYDWDSIKIVQKHFSKNNLECKMTHFYKTERDYNIYTWTFSRKKEQKTKILL